MALWPLLILAPALQDPIPPGPPERIGAYWGVMSTSRFEAQGEEWELQVVLGFPGRAMRSLYPTGRRESARQLTYLYGNKLYLTSPGQEESFEVRVEERLTALRRFTLRRALYCWPHGFDWSSQPEPVAPYPHLPEYELFASLGDDGRPNRMGVRRRGDQVLIEATDLTWSTNRFGTFPHQLTWNEGEALWTEEFVDVVTSRLGDTIFLPTDRQAAKGAGSDVTAPRLFTLPAVTGRRITAPAGLDLSGAVEWADGQLEGGEPLLELHPSGRVVALWIEDPAGKTLVAEGDALGLFLSSPAGVSRDRTIQLYREAANRDRPPGTLFLRVHAPGDERRAELVLVLK